MFHKQNVELLYRDCQADSTNLSTGTDLHAPTRDKPAHTRHRYRRNKTGQHKNRSKYKNGCHNNSAVTVCAAHHNINHAEELLAECMVFKWREGERERVRDTHIQRQTRVHTYTQTESPQGRLSSLWSVSLRAGELQLNPNGADLGNHLYLMKTLLWQFVLFQEENFSKMVSRFRP